MGDGEFYFGTGGAETTYVLDGQEIKDREYVIMSSRIRGDRVRGLYSK